MPNARYLSEFKHWHRLAGDARNLAKRMDNADARATMLRVAADYDWLALGAAVRIKEVKVVSDAAES